MSLMTRLDSTNVGGFTTHDTSSKGKRKESILFLVSKLTEPTCSFSLPSNSFLSFFSHPIPFFYSFEKNLHESLVNETLNLFIRFYVSIWTRCEIAFFFFFKYCCIYENLSGCLFIVLCFLFSFFLFPFIVPNAVSWSSGIWEVGNQREL